MYDVSHNYLLLKFESTKKNLIQLGNYIKKHYEVWKVSIEGLNLTVRINNLKGLIEKNELMTQVQSFISLIINFSHEESQTIIHNELYAQTIEEINKGSDSFRKDSREDQ